IRYFRDKGIIKTAKFSVVNGQIIYPDEYVHDGKPAFKCIKCGKSFNLDKIVKHMFSFHLELLDSSDTTPYFRKYPELIFYLETFVRNLESLEGDLKELHKEQERRQNELVNSEKETMKQVAGYAINTVAQGLVGFLWKAFLVIFIFTVIVGVVVFGLIFFFRSI
ncbi:MAG: hypothetical protein PHV06_05975, partial [bacterium]|nr:hypothetical protein [bacterium]